MPALVGVPARLLRAAGWLLLGGLVGLCAAAVGSLWWGLLLGAAATVALTVAAPPGWGARVPLAVGWAGVVLRLSLRRPEGDYVLGSDVGGYVLLSLALGLVLAAVLTVPARPREGGADSASGPPPS